MVSPRTINPRRVFTAPKPLPAGPKRRFSEADLESDLLDIYVDEDVRSVCGEISECETCESAGEEEEEEKEKEGEGEEEKEEDVEEKQRDDGLFDTVLKEMTDLLELEFDAQSPLKAAPKVRKTVCWAAKLAVVIEDPVDDVRGQTDCESEEE
jgi:ferredoxin